MAQYSDEEDRSHYEEEEEEEDEEEPDFSDDEDFVDEISDGDLMPDLMCQRPKESDGVDSVIVVDGVPAVGADRLEKLKGVVRKIFTKVRRRRKVTLFGPSSSLLFFSLVKW